MRKPSKLTQLLFVLLVATACGSCRTFRPPPMPIDPGDTDQCLAACTRMESLGCPEGAPLPDGTTCVKFCVDTQTAGHAMNPTCLAKIESCSEIEACSVNREGGR